MSGFKDGLDVLTEKIIQARWTFQGLEIPEVSNLKSFSHEICPVRADTIYGGYDSSSSKMSMNSSYASLNASRCSSVRPST